MPPLFQTGVVVDAHAGQLLGSVGLARDRLKSLAADVDAGHRLAVTTDIA